MGRNKITITKENILKEIPNHTNLNDLASALNTSLGTIKRRLKEFNIVTNYYNPKFGNDITGLEFGFLKVIEPINKRIKNGGKIYLCECVCGCKKEIPAQTLVQGRVFSCGCKSDELRRLNISKSKIANSKGLIFKNGPYLHNNELVYDVICPVCNQELTVKSADFKSKKMCKKCSKKISIEKIVKERIEKNKIPIGTKSNFLTIISEPFIERQKNRNVIKYTCLCECGNTTTVSAAKFKSGEKLSCGCKTGSIGEINIENILKDKKIEFKKEYKFNDLFVFEGYPLRFDFAIFKDDKLLFLIEYDGKQHRGRPTNSWKNYDYEALKMRDKMKDEYCLSHKIHLLRINDNKKSFNSLKKEIEKFMNKIENE